MLRRRLDGGLPATVLMDSENQPLCNVCTGRSSRAQITRHYYVTEKAKRSRTYLLVLYSNYVTTTLLSWSYCLSETMLCCRLKTWASLVTVKLWLTYRHVVTLTVLADIFLSNRHVPKYWFPIVSNCFLRTNCRGGHLGLFPCQGSELLCRQQWW
jgi:hypothetical protein